MVTSIHIHIEVKSGDIWHHYAAPAMFRHDVFFDLVAGIYGNWLPIVPPRGLPESLSFVTQHDWEQDSKRNKLHHAGWLSAKELLRLQMLLDEVYDGRCTNLLEYDLEASFLHTYINQNALAYHQGWDDLRFIFWFDN